MWTTGAPPTRASASSRPASASASPTPGNGSLPSTYSRWQSMSTSVASATAGGASGAPAICSRVFGAVMGVSPVMGHSAGRVPRSSDVGASG